MNMNTLALGALAVTAAIANAAELAAPAPEPQLAEEIAAAPGPDFDLAGERGLLGGRVGYNFGTGTLYRTVGDDNHDGEAEAEAEAEPEIAEEIAAAIAAAAPGPELDLAESRSKASAAGFIAGFGGGKSPVDAQNRLALQIAGNGRRRQLKGEGHEAEAEAEAVVEPEAAAPGPELDLATSRSSITLDPATLSRPELRYGAYVGQLGKK